MNIIKQSTTGNDTLLATVTTDANGYYSYPTTEKGNFTICAYINDTTQGDCKPYRSITKTALVFYLNPQILWVESFMTPSHIEKLITYMEKKPNILLKLYKRVR